MQPAKSLTRAAYNRNVALVRGPHKKSLRAAAARGPQIDIAGLDVVRLLQSTAEFLIQIIHSSQLLVEPKLQIKCAK